MTSLREQIEALFAAHRQMGRALEALSAELAEAKRNPIPDRDRLKAALARTTGEDDELDYDGWSDQIIAVLREQE